MKLNPHSLRAIRERSGMTKAELAARAGIDRTLVTRLENGERDGTPSVIRKLSTALAVSQLAICSIGDTDTDTAADVLAAKAG